MTEHVTHTLNLKHQMLLMPLFEAGSPLEIKAPGIAVHQVNSTPAAAPP